MSILKLELKNIGPFDHLELDLSDGNGRPHLGPHIIAGTNGSGKSTILRAIARLLDFGGSGSDAALWGHLVRSLAEAKIHVVHSGGSQLFEWKEESVRKKSGFNGMQTINIIWPEERPKPEKGFSVETLVCGYAPTRSLRQVNRVDLSPQDFDTKSNSLSFETTVDNERVQSWLLGLYSRMAIAEQKHQASGVIRDSINRFESGLSTVYGQPITLDVNVEGPSFEPRIKVFGKSLNFSQLPDGLRVTIGWFADYLMRQDRKSWPSDKRPGVILLDEVESHLHPLWQRRLLPGMKKALPEVQIIATSHSPFLISSCRGARIHVLETTADGKARLRESLDAPIGESVATILSDIFGVHSQFDIETEDELNEWHELNKQRLHGKLTTKESQRFQHLTSTLADRSEELKAMVGGALQTPPKKRKAS